MCNYINLKYLLLFFFFECFLFAHLDRNNVFMALRKTEDAKIEGLLWISFWHETMYDPDKQQGIETKRNAHKR